ncbi:MAG: right-handed parallel beta-helix repeat-containing protein [Myxococcaceae bacterium]
MVSSLADAPVAPPNSLRDCIEQANLSPGQQSLTFSPGVFNPGTIVLTSNLPPLTDPAGVVLDGANAANVIIDGSGFGGSVGLVLASNGNEIRNVTFQGFRGTGFSDAVITVSAGQVAVIDSVVMLDNAGMGIELGGDNSSTLIANTRFERTGRFVIRVRDAVSSNCASHTVIRNNVFLAFPNANDDAVFATGALCLEVADNQFTGFNGPGGHAIRFASGSSGCQVMRNVVLDSRSAIGLFTGTTGCRLGFNVVKDALGAAFLVGDSGSTGNTLEGNVVVRTRLSPTGGHGIYVYAGANDTRVFHNTVVGSEGDGLRVDVGPSGVRVHNNLLGLSTGAGMALFEPSVVRSHNGFFGNAGGDCAGGCSLGTGSVVGDPEFVNPTSPADDFRLASCSSPAVNAGLDLGADQTDLVGPAGGQLFEGTAPDLGALESACGQPAPPEPPSPPGPVPPWLLTVGCACQTTPASTGGLSTLMIWLSALALSRRRRGASLGR